jgi:sortase A
VKALGVEGRQRWMRRAERTAFVVGGLLVAVWAGFRTVGSTLERRDLEGFKRQQGEANVRVGASRGQEMKLLPTAFRPVDQSQWAEERIRAYQDTLSHGSAPVLGVLRIPRIGLEVPVLAGTSEWILDRGVGWIEETARPGDSGNVGIAGHRDGFFRGLKDVKLGDALELETPGHRSSYRISRLSIVSPDDTSVLESTLAPTVTLVTCYPFYFVGSAPQRYIVRAVLVETL